MSKPGGDIDTTANIGLKYLNGQGASPSCQDYCVDLRAITGARYVAYLHYDFGQKTVSARAMAGSRPLPGEADGGAGFGFSREEWEIDPDKFSDAGEGLHRHENLYSFCRGILSPGTAERIESQFSRNPSVPRPCSRLSGCCSMRRMRSPGKDN
jgi:hypothetical protein